MPQAKEKELGEVQQQKLDLETSITDLQALKDQAATDAAAQLQVCC